MKIMVCFDESKTAQSCLDIAVKHAKAFNAKVYVVTSMIGGLDVEKVAFDKREAELSKAHKRLKQRKIPCEVALLVRNMGSGENLVAFAREESMDEIIIGVKRRSKVGKLLFGSTAQYVILEAPCPVLTVK